MSEFKAISIERTNKTPQADFNNVTGNLILRGRSIPENPVKVYQPLIDWAEIYVKNPQKVTNLHLNLDYFNSASLLWISRIVKILAGIDNKDCSFYIHLDYLNEEYDDSETDEIKDIISSLVQNIGTVKIRIGIKVNIIDGSGKVISDSTYYL